MGSPTSNPKVNIQLLPAPIVDAFEDRRDLIVGQTGTGGTAVSGDLNIDMHLKTLAELRGLFGEDKLYWDIVSWREAVNVDNGGIIPKLDVIGVDADGGGTAATASHAFSGTATADGEFVVSVVDERKFSVTVSVTNGDTATEIGDAVVAAFGALDYVPFSSANVTGTVTYTADDVGTIGNGYGLKITGAVAGVSVVTTGWSGGATDPTVTSIFDAIAGRRYTGTLWPEAWNSQITVATDEFDSRFNASNNIIDGVVFHGFSDTVANIKTEIGTLNSQSLVLMGAPKIDLTSNKGPAVLQPADWVASYFMGVRDKRLSTGAQIADLITSTDGPLDATGGPSLASKPYFNTPLRQTPVTSAANLFTETEQIELEDEGFTTYGVNVAGNFMIMGPVVTTWTTDAAGNPNDSFHYLNYVDTGSVCREIIFRVLKATFAQSRLTQGDLIAGRSIENPASIKSKIISIYKTLADLALTQAGDEAVQFFSDNTTVEITDDNLSTRSVTITGVLPIVTQLGTINYNLALNFSVGSTGTQITL